MAKKTPPTKTDSSDSKVSKPPIASTEKSKKKTTPTTSSVNEVVAKNTSVPPPKDQPAVASTDSLDDSTSKFRGALIAFNAKLQQSQTLTNSMKNDFKLLEKMFTKELKVLQRNGRRKKQTTRSPSGFVKPTLISDELATFLKKDKGVQMARTDVTREINAYIREHNLQDKVNGRKINADTKLTKLLNLQSEDELTYFNLQRYMSPHFHKENKDASTSTATATATSS